MSGLSAPRVRPEAFEGIQNTNATAVTLALVTFLFTAGDRARQSEMRAACIKYIRNMISKASSHLPQDQQHVTIRGNQCRVYNGGQVTGFVPAMESASHANTVKALKAAWEAMHAEGLLDGEIENGQHSMMDICTFFMHI